MSLKKDIKIKSEFRHRIRNALARPDTILERSYGEVLKPETINYRTYKPERDGFSASASSVPSRTTSAIAASTSAFATRALYATAAVWRSPRRRCAASAWATSSWWCLLCTSGTSAACPTRSVIFWGCPPRSSTIIYYERYAVIQPGPTAEGAMVSGERKNLAPMDLLTEEEYLDILDNLPPGNQQLDDNDPNKFIAEMGAEGTAQIVAAPGPGRSGCLASLPGQQRDLPAAQGRGPQAPERGGGLPRRQPAHREPPRVDDHEVGARDSAGTAPLVPLDGGRFATRTSTTSTAG
jgi:DNA-directed RNA polymerase subunit beta'